VLTLEGRVPTAWLMDDLSASGIIGDARGASKEQGQAALEHWVARLRIAYREMAQFEFPANG
jgi:creatinine amidohydrolase/Fe(II)-dependent formamide hydrolase-like protein